MTPQPKASAMRRSMAFVRQQNSFTAVLRTISSVRCSPGYGHFPALREPSANTAMIVVR